MRMIDLHCNKLLPRSTFQCTALYFHKPPSFAYFLAILHTIHHKRSIILPSSFTVSRSHRGFTRSILSVIIWNFKTLLCLNFNSHLLHTKGFWICRQEQHHKDSLMLRKSSNGSGLAFANSPRIIWLRSWLIVLLAALAKGSSQPLPAQDILHKRGSLPTMRHNTGTLFQWNTWNSV